MRRAASGNHPAVPLARFGRSKKIEFRDALQLAGKINELHEVCHVERLIQVDGADGFTKAQGED